MKNLERLTVEELTELGKEVHAMIVKKMKGKSDQIQQQIKKYKIV